MAKENFVSVVKKNFCDVTEISKFSKNSKAQQIQTIIKKLETRLRGTSCKRNATGHAGEQTIYDILLA